MAIDDEIDAARTQIEFGRISAAPKVVTTILEGLAAFGLPVKSASFLMKKGSEKREDNTLYLLEAVISQVHRLQNEFQRFSDAHKQFIEDQFPRLMIEAVSKAERTGSRERIERLGMIVVHTLRQGPEADLDQTDEMLRVSVELSAADVDILVAIYSVEFIELAPMNFLPDKNVANRSWKQLQSLYPIFASPEVHSTCAKLQSLGLVTQVPVIPTMLDLTSIPYAILRNGAQYVEAIGIARTAKGVNA
jgi:hypothetical protein